MDQLIYIQYPCNVQDSPKKIKSYMFSDMPFMSVSPQGLLPTLVEYVSNSSSNALYIHVLIKMM